ncbi:MAG: T9SS type A sorting domain-containing protein [Saprospiraceae bacterium]|nr:T9SS type A sorting domain-containing protein [Saprospiraceae bacterium]
MRQIIFFAFLLSVNSLLGQFVTLNPSTARPEESATLIFDANQGNKELVGATKVYMHHGVVTDKVNGTAWKYVKGNWGQDDGIGLMTKVNGEANKWQITFNPSIRAHFGVPVGENIFRISCVFRSADGTKKGTIAQGEYGWGTVTSNGDIYVNLNSDNFVSINAPLGNESIILAGQTIQMQATTSSEVSNMKLLIDEGNGYEIKAEVNTGKTISYSYVANESKEINIKVVATINGQNVEAIKKYNVVIRKPTEIANLPEGLKSGANYDLADPAKVTLVLLAPHKEFVYAVGDFSQWQVKEENQMKRTPDGEYYWLELNDLTPQKDYVYQYWIDGKIKIADPYARQVADPWNDKWIEPAVFPNIPSYTREDLGIAAVFKTNQIPYTWAETEATWIKPNVNHLVIYELHIRDFVASHSYQTMIDTISYLKRLGVNAIEFMPLNEFEGNDSWGYNPSFFLALDKYYGTKEKLKQFIEIAHQNGIAVILDIVLNHAFGQSPMVQMYFDGGKPAANNPWFNREYVGQYQWGYDFNHESAYTKRFVDEVNKYWLEEFHFDGFRFDFTKGFTNYAPGGSVDGFDQSRINILKRMNDEIKKVDPTAYVILEHWSPANEEAQLATFGMKMWRNKSYDYVPAAIGNTIGSFTNMDATSHVTFYDSHDERRIAEHCITEGRSSGSYNVRDSLVMFERVKLAAAFTYLHPGPKMIWQFDELGYDIDINFNGRVGRKPYVWGQGSLKYYNSTLRQNIYKTYQGLLHVRNTITPAVLAASQKSHLHTGDTRRLSFNTPNIDLVVIGNFALTTKTIDPKFSQTGWWYNYFSGDSIMVTNVSAPIHLKAGEWHVFTTKRLADGQPDVVAVYENPVTINPDPFKGSDLIKVRFDATKASNAGTQGLIGASKVYFHSGVILNTANNNTLTNVKGNFVDDGIGLMTKVSDNIWEISITPNEYYNIPSDKEIFQIGMWFRNEDNTRNGYGFRDGIIYFEVLSDQPMLTVSPSSFDRDTEVTITLNTAVGNRELKGVDKIYMHSGAVLSNLSAPKGSDWKKVVGNWGMDDGVGLMSKVAGKQDLWQIKLKPASYYGLTSGEFPYWLGAVFRNATGTAKATTNPGIYDFGLVDAVSQDIFIKNQKSVNVITTSISKIKIFPNPTSSSVKIEGILEPQHFTIFSTMGKAVYGKIVNSGDEIDVAFLPAGLYYINIGTYTGKLIVVE